MDAWIDSDLGFGDVYQIDLQWNVALDDGIGGGGGVGVRGVPEALIGIQKGMLNK